MVRASTAKVGGLASDFQWLPKHFFSQFVSIYYQLLYQQFSPPVMYSYNRYVRVHVLVHHVYIYMPAQINSLHSRCSWTMEELGKETKFRLCKFPGCVEHNINNYAQSHVLHEIVRLRKFPVLQCIHAQTTLRLFLPADSAVDTARVGRGGGGEMLGGGAGWWTCREGIGAEGRGGGDILLCSGL